MRTVFADLTKLPATSHQDDMLISREAGPLLHGIGRGKLPRADAVTFFSEPVWQQAGWDVDTSAAMLLSKRGFSTLCRDFLAVSAGSADYWAVAQEPSPHLVGNVGLYAVQSDTDVLAHLPSAAEVAVISLYVFPQSRGQGWGQRMARMATDMALQNGVKAICAEARVDNIASQRALEYAGLSRLGTGTVSASTPSLLGAAIAVRFMRLASGHKPTMKDWPFLPHPDAKAVP